MSGVELDEWNALRAELERYREALERIASAVWGDAASTITIARQALQEQSE